MFDPPKLTVQIEYSSAILLSSNSSVEVLLQARRNSIQKGEKTPDDLLGTLLSSVDPEDGSSLTDEELWEDVHDVMGAGHETTGTTTAAVLYCVSTNPEVEEKLIAELREVCGVHFSPIYMQNFPLHNCMCRKATRVKYETVTVCDCCLLVNELHSMKLFCLAVQVTSLQASKT